MCEHVSPRLTHAATTSKSFLLGPRRSGGLERIVWHLLLLPWPKERDKTLKRQVYLLQEGSRAGVTTWTWVFRASPAGGPCNAGLICWRYLRDLEISKRHEAEKTQGPD